MNIKYMKWGWFSLFILLVLGQLQRFQITPTIAIYGHEIVLAIIMSGTVLHFGKVYVLDIWNTLARYKLRFFFELILCSLAIPLFFGRPESAETGLLYGLRLFFYVLGAMTFAFHQVHTLIPKQWVKNTIPLYGMALAMLGLAQYFFFPDTRFLFLLGWDDHYYRLISTLFDPAFTGIMLVFALLWMQTSLLHEKSSWFEKMMWVTMLIALLLTYSRASYVAYAAGSVIVLLKVRSIKQVVPVVLLIVGMFLLPRPASEGARLERTASITARLETTEHALKGITFPQVLFGQGWYAYNANRSLDKEIPNHSSTVDNSLLHIFLSMGVLGLLGFIAVAWKKLPLVLKYPQLTSISTALLTASLFNNVLFYPWVVLFYWGMLFTVEKQREALFQSDFRLGR